MNLKRITAFVMVLVMAATAALIPSQAVSKAPDIASYEERMENGTPTFSTDDFFQMMGVINTFTEIVTGKALLPRDDIILTVDETITSYCDFAVV